MSTGLVAELSRSHPNQIVIEFLIGLGILGLYAVVAPFLGLWLPRTRSSPIWRHERLTHPPVVVAELASSASAGPSDYEAEVWTEIERQATIAFRPIQLQEGERDVFKDAVFRACCELGWEAPGVLISLVDPEHPERGFAWREGAFTITNADEDALRHLAEDRARIARRIRDTELGRLLREHYTPKVQAVGIMG